MPNASRIVLGILYPIAALLLAAQTAGAQNARVYVTNSAGDNIHVIDPATNKVVQVIDGIEAAHGIDFSPDGTRVYVSNESDSTLDVFDAKTGRLASKVKLSGHPNNIAATKDGSRVVVGIAQDPGALDVIDTKTLKVAKSIPVDGRLHNVYVTPDNKYVVTGSIRTKVLTVIDLATEKVAWELKLDQGVRPMALEA
ncbi:MAG TPA: cytochrome D1 domain-containing protein, partial [Burkholderiales bacterium]|nr:cytochrome D1 domain-containing protein [Burkholderiales bacterium]